MEPVDRFPMPHSPTGGWLAFAPRVAALCMSLAALSHTRLVAGLALRLQQELEEYESLRLACQVQALPERVEAMLLCQGRIDVLAEVVEASCEAARSAIHLSSAPDIVKVSEDSAVQRLQSIALAVFTLPTIPMSPMPLHYADEIESCPPTERNTEPSEGISNA